MLIPFSVWCKACSVWKGFKGAKLRTVGVEFIVAWLGARTSSLSGIRASQEETKKLSKIVRNRMTALSVTDSIRDLQFVESKSEESLAEWEQLPGRTVGPYTPRSLQILSCHNDPKRFVSCLTGAICSIMKICVNPVFVTKLLFHHKARSFSPFRESGLCSSCG